jgi:hypothetical protein
MILAKRGVSRAQCDRRQAIEVSSMFFRSELTSYGTQQDCLLPYVPVIVEKIVEHIQRLHQDMEILKMSCLTGNGVTEWMQWLAHRRDTFRAACVVPVA